MSTPVERIVYVRPGHLQSDTCAQMAESIKGMNVTIAIENIDVMKQEYRARGIPLPSWLTPGVARIPMLAEVSYGQQTPILTAGLAAVKRIRAIAEDAFRTNHPNVRRVMKDGEKFTGGATERRSQPIVSPASIPVVNSGFPPSAGHGASLGAALAPSMPPMPTFNAPSPPFGGAPLHPSMIPQPSFGNPQQEEEDPALMVRQCKRRVMGDGEKFTGC